MFKSTEGLWWGLGLAVAFIGFGLGVRACTPNNSAESECAQVCGQGGVESVSLFSCDCK